MNRAGRWAGDGQAVNEDGTVSGKLVESSTASFWLGGVAAAYQTWTSLVERHLQAVRTFAMTGEEKPLRTTTNIDQALPYLPMAARSEGDPTGLEARAEQWAPGTVPEGVRFLTGQVDVQANRFVVLIYGWGPSPIGGLERWVVDWFSLKSSRREDGHGGYFPLDPPKYIEDWDRLIEKVITRRYALCDHSGRTLPVRAAAIDWGGKSGTSQRALEFWRKLRAQRLHWRVRLTKGDGRAGTPLIRETNPDARKREDRKSGAIGDVPQLLMNVNRIKDTVGANIAREDRGPGFFHFPSWLPTAFYEELTAETRTDNGWVNLAHRRNEALDLTVQADALSLWLRFGSINWSSPPTWAAEWDKNPEVLLGEESPKPAPRPTRRRVVRSKYLRG
jgi:phage terminase large subunit GpA-like protein